MFKCWNDRSKRQGMQMSASAGTLDTTTGSRIASSSSLNEQLKKKKSRSLASFFFRKKAKNQDSRVRQVSDTTLNTTGRMQHVKAHQPTTIAVTNDSMSRPPIRLVNDGQSGVDLYQQRRTATLAGYREHSIVPNRWRITQPSIVPSYNRLTRDNYQQTQYASLKSPMHRDTQLKVKDSFLNNQYLNNRTGDSTLDDQCECGDLCGGIDTIDACFGFPLLNMMPKYCLCVAVTAFIGTCVIVSLAAVFKK